MGLHNATVKFFSSAFSKKNVLEGKHTYVKISSKNEFQFFFSTFHFSILLYASKRKSTIYPSNKMSYTENII